MTLTLDPGRSPRLKFQLDDKNVFKSKVALREKPARKRFSAYLVRDKVRNEAFNVTDKDAA